MANVVVAVGILTLAVNIKWINAGGNHLSPSALGIPTTAVAGVRLRAAGCSALASIGVFGSGVGVRLGYVLLWLAYNVVSTVICLEVKEASRCEKRM